MYLLLILMNPKPPLMKSLLIIASTLFFFYSSNGQSMTAGNTNGKLYLRTHMWTGMYGSSLDISWIYLGNDGIIVRNPVHGVNPVITAKEKSDNPKNTGTYQLKDNKLLIVWSDGKTVEWKTEKKGADFSAINGGIVSRPASMPNNYRISGEYTASSVMPNVSSVQKLIFDKDGRFQMKQSGAITTPDATATKQTDKQGSYDISGNTLSLRFDNGETKRATLAIWNMDGKENLVINSKYYPLKK